MASSKGRLLDAALLRSQEAERCGALVPLETEIVTVPGAGHSNHGDFGSFDKFKEEFVNAAVSCILPE